MRDDGLVAIDTDEGHYLHEIGSEVYPEMRHVTVKPERVADYEEVAVEDVPPYTESEYKAKVSELIHERYSLDDEIALRANIEDEATEKRTAEYAEYLAYRKECKQRAREMLMVGGEKYRAESLE